MRILLTSTRTATVKGSCTYRPRATPSAGARSVSMVAMAYAISVMTHLATKQERTRPASMLPITVGSELFNGGHAGIVMTEVKKGNKGNEDQDGQKQTRPRL